MTNLQLSNVAKLIAQTLLHMEERKSDFLICYNTDYPDVRPLIFVPEIEDVKG